MLAAKKEQLLSVIQTIEDALLFISEQNASTLEQEYTSLFQDISVAIQTINKELFFCTTLNQYKVEELGSFQSEHLKHYIVQCQNWISFMKDTIQTRYSQNTHLDESFLQLLDYVNYVDYDAILRNTINKLLSRKPDDIKTLNRYYQRWEALWGRLDTQNQCYDVLEDRIHTLIEHRSDFEWLYNRLGDYRSKLVLHNMLYNWLTFDPDYIIQMKEGNYSDYYDLDLLQCNENEVVVDLGAYIGDSALDYIKVYQKYKRIYCYEITKQTVDVLKKNLNGYPNIEIRNKGAGASRDIMYISSSSISSDHSDNTVSKECTEGSSSIEIVSIDEDISEPVTLIKMDIEGAEQQALAGCKRHIQEERPKLLICVYHNNEDIWKIPRMITELRDDYTLYLRSNGQQWGPSEIVLFAL